MNLFKAMIMCEECGEIHAERWLKSENRHATTTTLFVLCDSCFENELRLSQRDGERPECEGCTTHQCKVDGNCPLDFDPFEDDSDGDSDVCFLCLKDWDNCKCYDDDKKCSTCNTGAVANESGLCDECESIPQSVRELM